MHFAIHFQPGCRLLQNVQGLAHFQGRRVVGRAEIGVRQQRRFGDDAKALNLLRGHDGVFGNLLGRGVVVDVGVHNKHLVVGEQQAVHGGIGADARAFANDLVDVVEVHAGVPPGAADQAVCHAFVYQHGANQHQAAAHFDAGDRFGNAFALGHAVVGLPEVVVVFALFDVDHFVIRAFFQAQAEFFDALGNHGRTANQNGACQFFVHHDLHGAQDAFALTFREHQAFALGLARRQEDGAHDGARGVHELLQFFLVGVHVGNGARGNALIGCSLSHGGRDFQHQARVKRLGNQILGAKSQLLASIGGGNGFVLLGLCQIGNGMHGGNFHCIGDGGCTTVKRATEDVGEAQDVIDLVGVVGAACGHDGVAAHGADFFGCDFGSGVGQRKDQRVGRHARHHIGLEHATGRQAQKHVGAINHFAQCALVGGLGVDGFVGVHQHGAALVHHAFDIRDPNVFAGQPQFDEQAQAGQRGGSCAAGDQLDLFDFFARHFQAVEQRRAHHDGGAVLVVVKDGNFQSLAQFAFDVKAVGRLDIFEVDAAKSWLQRGDDLDQLVGVFFVDFDVEHIDAGKFLEQNAFAFHHRFARQGTDIAQAQYGCAIGDHAYQVAARGVTKGGGGVLHDFFAGHGHAGRVSQCQVVLVHELFGCLDADFSGTRKLVIVERGLVQFGAGLGGSLIG